jgi:hypothetical protein
MLNMNQVRGGEGLEPIIAEVDEILASVIETTRTATGAVLRGLSPESESQGAREMAGNARLA